MPPNFTPQLNSEAKVKVALTFFEEMIITWSIIGQSKRSRCQSVARNILNKAILVLHSITTFQIVWNV